MGVYAQVAGAVIGLAGARQAKAASEMEARAYEEQAEMASIQARQQEEERNTQLRKQLASLGTSMSAQGITLGTSASVATLAGQEKKIAKKDISSIKLMGMANRRKFQIRAAWSRGEGKGKMTAAIWQAVMGVGQATDGFKIGGK